MSPDLRHLDWKSEWGFQSASDERRFYIRESAGSIIAGVVFGVILAIPTGVYGVWVLFTDKTQGSWVFAVMLLLISAVFTSLLVFSARRGRWMVVYDRGEPGVPGEIRIGGKRLAADRVRSLGVHHCNPGTESPRFMVVAYLHD
ncbi:MAG: hypothetical protein IAG10_30875, partial [Planctomycetaceae bacterium]|nr:hypothetical protein [Planctomycetaceae bacterium]